MKIRSYLNVVVLVHVFERKADGTRCRVPPSSSTNAATTLSSLSPWIELISICGPPLATEPGARFNAPHPHLPSPSTKGLPSLLCMTSLRNLSRQHKVVDCFCYRPGRVLAGLYRRQRCRRAVAPRQDHEFQQMSVGQHCIYLRHPRTFRQVPFIF